jgi:hypothetical protein
MAGIGMCKSYVLHDKTKIWSARAEVRYTSKLEYKKEGSTSGVTRDGHVRSLGEKILVITIIYTISDAFFPKSRGTAQPPASFWLRH